MERRTCLSSFLSSFLSSLHHSFTCRRGVGLVMVLVMVMVLVLVMVLVMVLVVQTRHWAPKSGEKSEFGVNAQNGPRLSRKSEQMSP